MHLFDYYGKLLHKIFVAGVYIIKRHQFMKMPETVPSSLVWSGQDSRQTQPLKALFPGVITALLIPFFLLCFFVKAVKDIQRLCPPCPDVHLFRSDLPLVHETGVKDKIKNLFSRKPSCGKIEKPQYTLSVNALYIGA